MGSYSIKDLEKVSGIKAHTIRMWEKRYGIVNPERTLTNIRFYNDSDLKKLINVSILCKHGVKISKIAKFSIVEINEKVLHISKTEKGSNNVIDNLVLTMIEMDEQKFDKLFSSIILQSGFEKAFLDIIYPLFERIGVLWQTGSIRTTHEHFVSNIVRQKILVAIDGQNNSPNLSLKKYLLFLPENEFHEIGLLFYYYILKKRGFPVIYLGPSVPFEDLPDVVKSSNINCLLTVINTSIEKKKMGVFMNRLTNEFKNNKVFIGGEIIHYLDSNLPENFVRLTSPSDFIKILT